MTRQLVLACLFGLLGASTAVELHAQAAPSGQVLRVFLECSRGRGGGGCDQREFRTQIDWVDWMRVRQDAQVHVIVTSQGTGSGGARFQIDFIGVGDLEGIDDELSYTSLGTDVRDETVRGLTRVVAVGLARYGVVAGSAAVLNISAEENVAPTDRLVTSEEVDDPWDFWVFEVDLSTDLNGETSRRNRRLRGGLEARRVTETWKIEVEGRGNWREDEILVDEDSTIVDTRRDWDAGGEAVYALAEHWSIGLGAEASAATRTNQDLSISAGPRLEFSVWPYEESPRRSLRVRYELGVYHFDYEDETLFGFLEETRGQQSLEVSINQRQPWGSVFANATFSHYLHDLNKNRRSVGGFLSLRVVRGLNLNINGRISWIHDQIFLAAQDVSLEEILLQRRRLASNKDWDFGIGFSFQFGSIFNNVVNNRF